MKQIHIFTYYLHMIILHISSKNQKKSTPFLSPKTPGELPTGWFFSLSGAFGLLVTSMSQEIFPTVGPTERTPKKNLRFFSQLDVNLLRRRGPLGFGPIQVLMDLYIIFQVTMFLISNTSSSLLVPIMDHFQCNQSCGMKVSNNET